MNTRTCAGIGLAVFALVGVLGFAQSGRAQDNKVDHRERMEMMQTCARACTDCQRACDACAVHCLRLLLEGKKEHLTALTNCQDCATCCAAAAQIVSRDGPHSVLICECCAKACGQCAEACEAIPDDKHMKACAEECRKCEKACKAMLKAHGEQMTSRS